MIRCLHSQMMFVYHLSVLIISIVWQFWSQLNKLKDGTRAKRTHRWKSRGRNVFLKLTKKRNTPKIYFACLWSCHLLLPLHFSKRRWETCDFVASAGEKWSSTHVSKSVFFFVLKKKNSKRKSHWIFFFVSDVSSGRGKKTRSKLIIA